MTSTLPLRVLHADVDLVVDGDDEASLRLSARLERIWSACRREAPAPHARRVVARLGSAHDDGPGDVLCDGTGDGPVVVALGDADRMPTALTHVLVRTAIESGVAELLMLHASALSDRATGAAVVCVAPGRTGKTTLCRTLGPGRRYLTDETVGLHPDGRLVPFPKPLSVRRQGGEVKDEVAPADVGLSTDGASPRLAAMLLLHRDPGHRGAPAVRELGLFETVMALCEETSSLDRLDRPLHLLADLLDSTRPALSVTYAEVETLRPLVQELTDTARPAVEGPR